MGLIVNFIGRLGRDAEKHDTQNGTSFITFNVATDVYNPQTKQNDTLWVRVTDGSERTMKMLQYLKKGSMLSICGELRTSIYNGQNGATISHDVRCFNWDFVRSGKQEGDAVTTQTTTQTTPQVTTIVTENVTPQQVAPTMGTFVRPQQTQTVAAATTDNDDDLPF